MRAPSAEVNAGAPGDGGEAEQQGTDEAVPSNARRVMGLSDKAQPMGVEINGKPLACLVCGHDSFWKREAQLNTAGASLLGFDWANATGVCYVCAKCGYIHWFLPP